MMINEIEAEYLTCLRERMVRKDLTRKQLSEVVGVTPRTMGRILTGESPLKVTLLFKICDALEIHAPAMLNQAVGAVMAEKLRGGVREPSP